KRGRWRDGEDGKSDEKMLLMVGPGRVKGSIRKTTSGTDPKEEKKRSNGTTVSARHLSTKQLPDIASSEHTLVDGDITLSANESDWIIK
ncbi:uncharacterized protein V6R79_018268, partial [Siganus canaliculatus]